MTGRRWEWRGGALWDTHIGDYAAQVGPWGVAVFPRVVDGSYVDRDDEKASDTHKRDAVAMLRGYGVDVPDYAIPGQEEEPTRTERLQAVLDEFAALEARRLNLLHCGLLPPWRDAGGTSRQRWSLEQRAIPSRVLAFTYGGGLAVVRGHARGPHVSHRFATQADADVWVDAVLTLRGYEPVEPACSDDPAADIRRLLSQVVTHGCAR